MVHKRKKSDESNSSIKKAPKIETDTDDISAVLERLSLKKSPKSHELSSLFEQLTMSESEPESDLESDLESELESDLESDLESEPRILSVDILGSSDLDSEQGINSESEMEMNPQMKYIRMFDKNFNSRRLPISFFLQEESEPEESEESEESDESQVSETSSQGSELSFVPPYDLEEETFFDYESESEAERQQNIIKNLKEFSKDFWEMEL